MLNKRIKKWYLIGRHLAYFCKADMLNSSTSMTAQYELTMAAVLYIISQMCNIYYALKASNHSHLCRYTLMQLRQQESLRPVLYVKILAVYRWHQIRV